VGERGVKNFLEKRKLAKTNPRKPRRARRERIEAYKKRLDHKFYRNRVVTQAAGGPKAKK